MACGQENQCVGVVSSCGNDHGLRALDDGMLQHYLLSGITTKGDETELDRGPDSLFTRFDDDEAIRFCPLRQQLLGCRPACIAKPTYNDVVM